MPSLLVYVSSWLAVIAAVWKLFGYITEVAAPEFSARITVWINSLGSKKIESGSKVIVYGMFINFFGDNHWSKKCIKRSLIYSCMIIVLILFYWELTSPGSFKFFFTYGDKTTLLTFGFIGGVLTIFFLIALQDYFVLLKTRLLLKMIVASSLSNMVVILLLDLLVSVILLGCMLLISGGFIYLYLVIYGIWTHEPYQESSVWTGSLEIAFQSIFDHGYDSVLRLDYFGKFYFTAFLGTFWILLIQITGMFTYLATIVLTNFGRVSKLIDIQNKPIKSLGAMAVIIISLLYLCILPFYLIFK